MSQDDIDRLITERSLVRQEFDDAQVAGYWAKAVGALTNARVAGLSSDTAFQIVYTGALQATLACLAAHGLRVKSTASHYKAFLAMQKLDESLRRHGSRFDALRTIRHDSVYEPTEDEAGMAAHLAEAFRVVAEALPAISDAISAARPNLRGTLAALDR